MKLLGLILFLTFVTHYQTYLFSQVENIPATHEVYNFLARMYAKGILDEYDDVVLPLSRKQVKNALTQIRDKRNDLSSVEQKKLERIYLQLGFAETNQVINFFDSFPVDFLNNVIDKNEKHLYSYRDSSINFYVDPLFEFKFMYSNKSKRGSSILNFGGRVRGTYDDWLGYYVEASNGSVYGDRLTAGLDKRIGQSFTFNDTEINFFDNTQGYFRVERGPVNLQLGRERILWGTGRINKLILSSNPQIFDFVKFNFAYKSLRYDFLHGWLVMKPETRLINQDLSKEKRSKYIAISRLGITPIADLNLGISQMIIYSNRPFEAAYLNPFIFWESAQRSLNDLDNSFLTFDGKYRIFSGLEINATALFDDINFTPLFKGDWALHNNRFAWQAGLSLTSPLIFANVTLNFEYLQLRPYLFSHDGYPESLTFTNNSYSLGPDLNPNSTLLSINVMYDISETVNLSFFYNRMLHGNNEYDASGNIVKNYGGNVFEYFKLNDPNYAYLLDGIRETENRFRFNLNWQVFNGIYYLLDYEHRQNSYNSDKSYNTFFSSINISLN